MITCNRATFNREIQRKQLIPVGLLNILLRVAQRRGVFIMPYKDIKKLREQSKKYYKLHKKERNDYNKKWYYINKNRLLKKQKLYTQEHKKEISLYQKEYRKTLKGKQADARHHSKRKNLGFEPLNEPFYGSHAHHIDNNRVVYIPAKIHKKYTVGWYSKKHRLLVLKHYGSLEKMIANAKQLSLV